MSTLMNSSADHEPLYISSNSRVPGISAGQYRDHVAYPTLASNRKKRLAGCEQGEVQLVPNEFGLVCIPQASEECLLPEDQLEHG